MKSLTLAFAGLSFVFSVGFSAAALAAYQCPTATIVERACVCVETRDDQYLYVPTLQVLKSDGGFTSASLGNELQWDDCKEVISHSPFCKQ
jgi:hypothetical protein